MTTAIDEREIRRLARLKSIQAEKRRLAQEALNKAEASYFEYHTKLMAELQRQGASIEEMRKWVS